MNFSALVGIIAALAVFFTTILTATSARSVFLDPHGILVVFGGTLAATMLCFPLKTIPALFKVMGRKFLSKYGHQHEIVVLEIVDLAKAQQENAQALRDKVDTIKNEFLKEGVQLIVDGGLSPQKMDAILKKRAAVIHHRHQREAMTFKTIAKFPPAFGLMGTTVGMIALLNSLGSADAFKRLGPAMAIGLVATLYGLTLANFVLIPIGENLTKLNEEDQVLRRIITDGIKLLRDREHPLIVEEDLKSYLTPTARKTLAKAG
ncbi:hypothetical protein AZI86_01735 [Bdellovibrio bacteriovorus]|uniref:MotA/TolQ/ExbB proton channel domain-containing protein n=1 Tax=Bdellovibrio bacteriovorus TaxID=959 RepID=A0A150WN29_BDEBC|nr:MotA/TolQ/ExbB proton channel family protein [Bdellovibrio bacteriovorus]KYG65820.1 hypothetical protein AZI86_01735 [Bdellovibrio bacteriovorus]